MKIPYKKIVIENKKTRKIITDKIDNLLKNGPIIMGPQVEKMEKKLARYLDSKFALLTGSGTDSILLALLTIGLKKNDEVITTPLSWITSATPITLLGAKPVFVDVKNDLNIDEKEIEKKITKRTKAILPVHFTGNPCSINVIKKISKKYNLKLIEDCAQAFGTKLLNKYCGTFGDIGCFSLNPMKNLNASGEAGLVVTNSKKIYEKMKILRYAGTKNKTTCLYSSINLKPDTIQTIFLDQSLKEFKNKIKLKNKFANYYIKNLTKKVAVPFLGKKITHTFYAFTILANKRSKLINFLKNKKIETKIEHPILIPDQKAFIKYSKNLNLPNAKRLSKLILSLPIHEYLKFKDLDYVIKNINTFYNVNKKRFSNY